MPMFRVLAAQFLILFSAAASAPQDPLSPPVPTVEIEEAVKWIRAGSPSHEQYDYVVSASVRLIFFWLSRDDVGQGYIRAGPHPAGDGAERLELLMGSDPRKAPMRINRWGAATEVYRGSDCSGAFFGFMKSSEGQSVSEMKAELSREAESRKHRFAGTLVRQDRNRSVAVVVPISSDTDYRLDQLSEAERMVVERLAANPGLPRRLEASDLKDCSSGRGFLFTVRELIEASLAGLKPPQTRCYAYNGRRYELSLLKAETVAQRKVTIKYRGAAVPTETVYRDLKEAEFRTVNSGTGSRTDFKILYHASGKNRGIPVVVEYQPAWWFRVTLKARPQAVPPMTK
ncbi:MAG: hypothetical protein HXY20_07340 [Acidobacteria bacterium]|nr:hypothetical protein [Acidobacteriota bacterium]